MATNNIFLKFPVIKCERIILRKMLLKDADSIYNFMSDYETVKYLGTDAHKDLSQTKRYIRRCLYSYRRCGTGEYVIVSKSTGEIVGICGFRSWDQYNKKAEFSGCLSRKHQRNGFLFEAFKKLIGICFKKMKINRLEGYLIPGNIPSEKLLLKIGMSHEGTLRQSYYHKGKFFDLKAYAILKNAGLNVARNKSETYVESWRVL